MRKLCCPLYGHLTICLLALRCLALCNFALLLQINMPTLCCTRGIFQCKREDGIALLNSVFAVRVIRFQRLIDEVKGMR
jgi:hypothetical protein